MKSLDVSIFFALFCLKYLGKQCLGENPDKMFASMRHEEQPHELPQRILLVVVSLGGLTYKHSYVTHGFTTHGLITIVRQQKKLYKYFTNTKSFTSSLMLEICHFCTEILKKN